MKFSLSALGDSAGTPSGYDVGVSLDTSAVPITSADPAVLSTLNLSSNQMSDLMTLPSGTQCYPSTFVGPLPPGASYCPDAALLAGTPSIAPSALSSMPWGTLAAVLLGLVALTSIGGRR
jgi:hypothetical protein